MTRKDEEPHTQKKEEEKEGKGGKEPQKPKDASPKKLGENESKDLSPETRTLLDEDFWKDATPEKVQELISKGADVNAKNKNGLTAAHFAAQHGDISLLKILADSKADLNQGDNQGETPAHKITKNNQQEDMIKILAEYGADFTIKNIHGESSEEYIQKYANNPEQLKEEIASIQHKNREPSDKEKKVNDRLTEGSKEGKNDPRNELNESKSSGTIISRQKEY